MNIGIVGGLDRNQRGLIELAEAHGHRLETHTGNLAGPASTSRLRLLVSRADLLLVLTDVNSHNAVKLTRKIAQQSGRPVSLLRRLGRSQFLALLQGLTTSSRAPSVAVSTSALASASCGAHSPRAA